MSSKFIKT